MSLRFIIGLGNADPRYQNTYHNVGSFAIDWLKQRQTTDHLLPHVTLLATSGFMNESGKSVRELLMAHHATPRETMIIHDDSDIALGMYKLSFGRGAAGHKGIEDIINELRTNAFWRLRIGIRNQKRREDVPRPKAGEFVLKKMSSGEEKKIISVIQESLPAIQAMQDQM